MSISLLETISISPKKAPLQNAPDIMDIEKEENKSNTFLNRKTTYPTKSDFFTPPRKISQVYYNKKRLRKKPVKLFNQITLPLIFEDFNKFKDKDNDDIISLIDDFDNLKMENGLKSYLFTKKKKPKRKIFCEEDSKICI